MRIIIAGPDFDTGAMLESTLAPQVGPTGDGAAGLDAMGLPVLPEDGTVKLEEPMFGTPFYEKLSRQYDFYADEPVRILRAEVEADRMAKEIFFLPAFVLLLLLILVQRRRATQAAF